MFCKNCGKTLVEEALFCPHCGAKLNNEEMIKNQIDESDINNEMMTDKLDVLLTDIGNNKVKVIKVVREWTGLGLKEAKELVEKAPVLMKKSITQEDAELIKRVFAKEGATVSFIDQKGSPVNIVVHCKNCGEVMRADSDSCTACGFASDIPVGRQTEQTLNSDSLLGNESLDKEESATFKEWWGSCSDTKKILIIVGAILIGGSFIVFREFWMGLFAILFGIVLIIGVIITLTTGSKEEKMQTREMIVKTGVGFIIIVIIVFVVVVKPDFLSEFIQPGANVRNAYLSQYSEKVTIEEAFDDFFSNGKWSTYKEDGYSYVLFTGTCEYLGKKADVRVTFKITGENFTVDSLDINGRTQNDLILYSLLSAVYEDY